MYSKETFVIDISIRPFKFAKFELSGSISCALKRGKARLNLSRRRFPMGTGRSEPGGRGQGGTPPPLFLGEQQPYLNQGGGGGADYAHHDITFPLLLIFRSSYGPVYPLSDHLHGF